MEQPPRPGLITVDNETNSQSSRLTADGRTLTYKMSVLQQPVRARACGQGAKSSADRRPVDPPPIVELRIFEGEKADNDITFHMSANYFLFATLEPARHTAQGRMTAEKNTVPVLTGTPVAGMVYLDRPKPAGYFIFPDLSVRHEGKYRLSFALFEDCKSPKDDDKPEDTAMLDQSCGVEHHVNHRLEVKSAPFHVFSAKKFPGLTESTHLSRMVAEQGCRVRIRRDVRMRRREPKSGSKEWDEYEEETAAARARASATPEQYLQQVPNGGFMEPIPRPRSASNASHQSVGSLSRRPSVQEMGPAYQAPSYGTAPHTPQSGAYPQASPYGSAQSSQFQQGPFLPQQQQQPRAPPMQPAVAQYQTQTYPAPPPVPTSSHQNAYPPAPAAPQPPQAHYVASSSSYESASQPARPSVDYSSQVPADYRRGSAQQIPPPPPPQGGFSQPAYSSQVPSQQQQQQTYSQPPPLPMPSTQRTYQGIDLYANNRPPPPEPLQPRPIGTDTSMSAKSLPPINTSMMMPSNKLEAASPISVAPQSSYFTAPQTPHDKHKRSFGNSFSDRHHDGPLRQGARPLASHSQVDTFNGPDLSVVDEDGTSGELDPMTLGMAYRRADGRRIQRQLPGHS